MRLTQEEVDRQCAEMWDALRGIPQDENYDPIYEQAVLVEKDLRDRLAAQERLFDVAPELLEVLEELVYGPGFCGSEEWRQVSLRRTIAKAESIIAKAKGEQS